MAKKTHQALFQFGLRTSVMAVASCLALSGISLDANAAGLGKIVVLSALGQPLRAEIEVSATREELSDMKAQLASPDAFKQAGLDYATTLLSIKFNLDKRANGQSIIKLSSDRPINDPFVDMLLELNWPSGRLVREYTFLLDPPEVASKAVTPVAPALVKPATATSRQTAVMRAPAQIDEELRGKALAKVRSQESSPKSEEPPAGEQESREVKRGDTLQRIARETKPEGVSLEQMLVGLLRANQDAFDGGNMNRLKAGKILSVPDKSAVEAVSTSEAKKIVVAQSSDWNAYRSKLAAVAAQAPVKEDAAKQEDAGKITAKVEDKAAPTAEPKDQLKVSKTETAAAKPGTADKRSEEDKIAAEKALKEANERVAMLEKTLAKQEKALELKNQGLAELQKQAATKAVPEEVKKPVEEAAPQVPPPVASPAKVEPPVVVAEKPAEVAVEAKPAEPEVKPEEVKPAPKPVEAPKPKPVPPPPPPEEEPGFIAGLLDNPLALGGGVGILALIAAYFVARRRRAGKGEEHLDLSSTLTPQSSGLSANSVFRSTGGQSVDTSHTPAQTDFSQAGPGSIDTDEVDPVAEADVYMAYGRDAQAEEILVEARQKDPKRYAIHLKLLEIYSNRKDLKQFETLATDLYTETGGVGADWEKAAAMGIKLDPGNPLFGASAQVSTAAFDADATVIVSSRSMKNTVTLPGELSQLAEVASVEEPSPAPVAADLTSLDFDLGLEEPKASGTSGASNAAMDETPKLPEPVIEAKALDFDLAVESPSATESGAAGTHMAAAGLDFDLPDISTAGTVGKGEAADLDFDVGVDSIPEVGSAGAQSSAASVSSDMQYAAPVDDGGVEFDVSLTESTFLGRSMPDSSSFDMSAIDLDLKAPELEIRPPAAQEPSQTGDTALSPFDSIQVTTAVNPDFAIEQAETIVNPQFGDEPDLMPEQDFSTLQQEPFARAGVDKNALPEHDFSTVQAETLVNPQFESEQDAEPEFDISANEEVTTKLDLAKAYEEMGDFEGARELLQEVVKEGDLSQREKARAILAKIGE